ncbi:MAG: HEPN domain-containing protein [Spirochaetes bacterium]|nr:HEPN domain-containing protein [Spirochaetota bacterium]
MSFAVTPFKSRRELSLSKKKVRKLTGFNFFDIGSDPENWVARAREFRDVAELIAKSAEYSPPIPYYYNAGLSLELLLKAIAIAQEKEFETNHRLNDLCKIVGMELSKDQEATIELLSEIIVWSGRYPIPKKEGRWDNYYDVILEKHIVREQDVNASRAIANRARFPTLQNYLAFWEKCESLFESSKHSKA